MSLRDYILGDSYEPSDEERESLLLMYKWTWFLGVLGLLLMKLFSRDRYNLLSDGGFLSNQKRNVVDFSINIFVMYVVSVLLMSYLIGLVMWVGVFVLHIVVWFRSYQQSKLGYYYKPKYFVRLFSKKEK